MLPALIFTSEPSETKLGNFMKMVSLGSMSEDMRRVIVAMAG